MAREARLVKRKVLIILLLMLTSIGAASWWYARARTTAAAEFPSDVLALVPGDASMIVYADMAVLRGEPLVQRLASKAQAVKPGNAYAAFAGAGRCCAAGAGLARGRRAAVPGGQAPSNSPCRRPDDEFLHSARWVAL